MSSPVETQPKIERDPSGAPRPARRRLRARQGKHSVPRRSLLRRKSVLIPLAVVVLVLVAVSGYAVYSYFHLQGEIAHHVRHVTAAPKGKPFNALLVGSDSRAGPTPQQQISLGASSLGGGQRADTLILAHVDPTTDHVIMVQFPRDMWVPISGHGKAKINTALDWGRSTLVQTIKNLTGLGINHYVQVNLAGFRDLVDAIGGVDVCIAHPIPFDPHTGIEVKKPGMIHFNGDRALRFVRARHVFAHGDFTRIENQQKFLAAAINKATSASTFFHVSRIRKLLDVAGKNLVVDDKTSPLDLYHLGQRFRAFNPRNYEAYTAPNLGPGWVGSYAVVLGNWPAMHLMFHAIARNESPAAADGVPNVDPATIRLGVYNGTRAPGAAAAAAAELRRATESAGGPVNVTDIANAGRLDHRRTRIVYSQSNRRAQAMAKLIAAAVPGANVSAGKTKSGVDVAVIVGKRFATKKVVEVTPIPIPRPGALPAVCRR